MASTSNQSPTIIDTAKCTHAFPNFTSRDAVWWTAEFRPPTLPNHCFQLGIYSTNTWDDFKKEIFCCLWISPFDDDENDEKHRELAVQYRVSILDRKGVKHCIKEVLWNYVENAKWGRDHSVIRLISHANLLNPANRLLPYRKLTIYCEVDVLSRKIPSILPHNPDTSINSSCTQNDFESLFDNSKFSDVVLVVGEREFRAHKNILVARSKVFDEMFEETTGKKTKSLVKIKNMDVEVFEQVLRYIYSGTVRSKLDYESAMELLIAADMYQLDELKSICAQFLGLNLTIDTVAYILERADIHRAPELKAKCIKYIAANSKNVLETSGWTALFSANRTELISEIVAELTKARPG